jgi:general secretion pathway protein I
MRSSSRWTGGRSAGFSLLEMLVAISILGLSLGALYQATGGATRNVRIDEKYAYGVELARSVLANNAMVPQAGVRRQGETDGGFSWSVEARPRNGQRNANRDSGLLYIEVVVSWFDAGKRREVVLNSVVEGVAK